MAARNGDWFGMLARGFFGHEEGGLVKGATHSSQELYIAHGLGLVLMA